MTGARMWLTWTGFACVCLCISDGDAVAPHSVHSLHYNMFL